MGSLPSGAEEPPPGPAVQIRVLDGPAVAGDLTDLRDGTVRVQGPVRAHEVPLGTIVGLRVVRPARPALAGAPHTRVTLVGGEVLVGRLAGSLADGDGIVLENPAFGRVELLFDVIRSLAPVPADAGPCYEPEHRRGSADEDVAHLTSGDAFTGIVVSGSEVGFVIETSRGRERPVDLADLLVLHVANEPLERHRGLTVEVETVDGSHLVAGGDVSLTDGRLDLALRSLPKKRMQIAVASIRVLRANGGAFVYASDLPFESEFFTFYPDETEQRALLENWYGARARRRPSGCPLRLDGTTYHHGFAVQARTRIALKLGSAFARFETLFGVDDEVPLGKDHGIVDARIFGDGKVLWEAEGVRIGEAPRRVGPLDVSQVQTLVLEVDFGAALQTWDRGTWADPILVRK